LFRVSTVRIPATVTCGVKLGVGEMVSSIPTCSTHGRVLSGAGW
jgi:hypothetical protein